MTFIISELEETGKLIICPPIVLFCIINCSRSFYSVGSSIILNSLWVFRETIRQFSGRQRNFFDCVRTLSERNCCNVAGLSGAVWQGRGGHAPCFMNGLVALGGGREGGEEMLQASHWAG